MPMLPVGLAWRSDPRETMRSFRLEEATKHCLGLETAGPRPEISTSYLKRSDESVGLTALPTREIEVSGGLVQKTIVRVAAGASALVAMLLAGGASRWK